MKATRALVATLMVAAGAAAQDGDVRAWQQRLDIAVPAPVPIVELEAVNPFATDLDADPKLLRSQTPERLDVRVDATAAAYVDREGDCLGAVPLDLPFAGIGAELVSELTGSRFEPARTGAQARPSWTVITVRLEGRIKEGAVLDQQLERPDPAVPPRPEPPIRIAPPGNLASLPATDPPELTSLATPKRMRLKVDGREIDTSLRALVHVSADGNCTAFVPLDVDSGLAEWFSAYLASWRLSPGLRSGDPVDAWMLYTARVRIETSNFKSETVRVVSDRVYRPEPDSG